MPHCDKTPLLRRICVDQPEALQSDPWRSHLGSCANCRNEYAALNRSLVLFKFMETERLGALAAVPSWERFSERLQARIYSERRRRRFRIPLAAAMAGLLVLAGAVSWNNLGERIAGRHSAAPAARVERAPALHPAAPALQPADSTATLPSTAGGNVRFVAKQSPSGSLAETISTSTPHPLTAPAGHSMPTARRMTQLPWIDVRSQAENELVQPQFMMGGSQAVDPILLAPVTPLRSVRPYPINFASYSGPVQR